MRTFYFLIVLMVLLLAMTMGIKAQTCTINVGKVDPVYREQVVTVPINVHDFKSVGAFQFEVDFTTSQLELADEVTNSFNGVGVFATLKKDANASGKLVIGWSYDPDNVPSSSPLTQSDGTLMGLKFYVKSTATLAFTAINIATNSAFVVNSASTSLLLGTTNGGVNVAAAALTPTIIKQLKTGNDHVVQLYCQNFINMAGFEIKVNYPASTYPGLTPTIQGGAQGSITFPNTGITATSGDFVTAINTNQVFMSWSYSGFSKDAVTLESDGSGVLAEIDFGTTVTLTDITFASAKANSIANSEISMSADSTQVTTATATLGTVVNAAKGSVVSVPLNVTNFKNVGAFQFKVQFTTADLELAELPTFTSGPQDPSGGYGAIISNTVAQANSSGYIILQWNYSGVAGQELNWSDGTPLMSLKFLVKGTAPGSSSLSFATGSIVINPSATNILRSGYPGGGSVVFQKASTPGVTLGTNTIGSNNKVTIPITVTNFSGIAGLEIHVTVPTNFTMAGSDITASSDLTALNGTFVANVVGTDARITWVYNTITELNLTDGKTLANLVFTYTGTPTTATIPVSFVSAITNDINDAEIKADTTNGKINLVLQPIVVNAKVFLQGPFSSGSMTTSLNSGGFLATAAMTQPYSAAPFSYAGTEHVAAGFFAANPTIVDWVLIELRDAATHAITVARAAALLKSNGTIVDVNGSSAVPIPSITTAGSYYIVVKHRNHLAIMSATAQSLSSSSALYDFTTAQAQAFGTNPMTGTGPFLMWAGDVNKDGQLTTSDFDLWLPDAQNALTGYKNTDMNMDGQVTTADFDLWLPNAQVAATSKVPQ